MDVGTSLILVLIPHVYHIQGNVVVMATNTSLVLYAHAEIIGGIKNKIEGIEPQERKSHVCSNNYEAGKADNKYRKEKKWKNFNFFKDRFNSPNRNNNVDEVVAEAIDIVAATRADRIWITWSRSSNSVVTTEIHGQTAPNTSFEGGLEQQQRHDEENLDQTQPVSVLEDDLGQQQQECNIEEVPDITLSASPSEVGGMGE